MIWQDSDAVLCRIIDVGIVPKRAFKSFTETKFHNEKELSVSSSLLQSFDDLKITSRVLGELPHMTMTNVTPMSEVQWGNWAKSWSPLHFAWAKIASVTDLN